MVATKPRSKVVRSLRGGQITIPAEFRKELGISEDTLLNVTLTEDGDMLVRPLRTIERPSGSEWLRELYLMFEPVRQQIRESGISEDELNQLIDDAVAEARAERYARKRAEPGE